MGENFFAIALSTSIESNVQLDKKYCFSEFNNLLIVLGFNGNFLFTYQGYIFVTLWTFVTCETFLSNKRFPTCSSNYHFVFSVTSDAMIDFSHYSEKTILLLLTVMNSSSSKGLSYSGNTFIKAETLDLKYILKKTFNLFMMFPKVCPSFLCS